MPTAACPAPLLPAAPAVVFVQVLVDLVLLYFNPDIEAATLVSQALPVFFQNYAELTALHQQFLATAFMPAARRCVFRARGRGARLLLGFVADVVGARLRK